MEKLIYTVPALHEPGAVLAWLQSHHPVRVEHKGLIEKDYLDTFDWRLFKAGWVMEALRNRAAVRLVWRALDSCEVFLDQEFPQAPRFAWDLPEGPLRDRLAPVLDVRALLPMLSTRTEWHRLSILNADGKTVLRVELSRDRQGRGQGGEPRDPPTYVRFQPLRGYDKPYRHILKAMRHELNMMPCPRDPFLELAEAEGKAPGRYSSRPQVQLQPTERTDVAAKKILHELLDIMLMNEDGVRRDLDSEFLHDYRVSIRRTRSLLSQVKKIFPEQRVARYRKEFAWLGQVTTPVRDMDVYLLSIDGYQASLPEALRAGLEDLKTFLVRRKTETHAALVKALDSARYRRLIESWRTFLESDVPQHTTLANAMRPVGEVASKRIWKVYKLVLKEGAAIDRDSPPEDVHELRKTCKKLRYLMEFFRSLYPRDRIDQLIKVLKGFQDNLGEYQDLFVQQESLKHFQEEMAAEGGIKPLTQKAMERLVEDLHKRQDQVCQEFAERFAAFSAKKNRTRFAELFSRPAPGLSA